MTFMKRLENLEVKGSVERVPATCIWKAQKLTIEEWNEAVKDGNLREHIKASSECSMDSQHMHGA